MALKNFTIKSPTLIRPFGVSNLPANHLNNNDKNKKSLSDESESLFDSWNSPQYDSSRVTSVRVYEGRLITPNGRTSSDKRCYLKEFLPIGLPFGKNELYIIRKLTNKWNNIQMNQDEDSIKLKRRSSVYNDTTPPFPRLIGSMYSDETIESMEFRQKWRRRFPGVKPPESDNLWLFFEWDEHTFRTMRSFAPLPQVIEGLDYFNKINRINKRWLFMKKVLRKCLESVDFLHTSGYCHNAISIQSLWMSTTIQQQINNIKIQITDLGACRKLSDDMLYARAEMIEDYYQLAFVFLEFVISSFCDDNMGARKARDIFDTNRKQVTIFTKVDELDLTQISQREFQRIYEVICTSDFQKLRQFVGSIVEWRDAYEILERDDGAAWKLLFRMLARGSLYESDRVTPIRITGRRLIKDSINLFSDTFK
mmetsp:Transcript_3131/g.2780  ORF Transcript_3131/g.2780 Transcript_3131/m.2780 type:complete len:423 (-) Transcript_3131:93-1361(-)